MKVIRYIAFIPLALLASVIAGPIGYYSANIVPAPEVFFPLVEGLELNWLLSGLFSGFAFFVVGFKVAPVIGPPAKWSLVSIAFLLGLISAIGSASGEEAERAWAGIAVALAAFGVGGMSCGDLIAIFRKNNLPGKAQTIE